MDVEWSNLDTIDSSMIRIFCLLLLTVSMAIAAKGEPTTWMLYSWAKGGKYRPSTTDMSFNIPIATPNAAYATFLITSTDTNLLGNLTGKSLTASIAISTNGNPVFVYGGQGSWNTGTLPAHCRFFFSSRAPPYSQIDASRNENAYWWNSTGFLVLRGGDFVLIGTFDPANWSNANGKSASANLAPFQEAMRNVKQIGLAFGGGSFYDVGVAIKKNTGTDLFQLLEFSL